MPAGSTPPHAPVSTRELIRGVTYFAELDDAMLEMLASQSRRRRFGAGEALFHEGDPGHTLHVVVSGCVNIQKVTSSGVLLHLNRCGPGEAFGEMSLIDGKPRSADAVTASAAELLMLGRAEFLQCVERSPRIAFGVMTALAERVRVADQRLERQVTSDVLGRVSMVLLRLAGLDSPEKPTTPSPWVVRVGQQAIADQAGTTRETVNRALARLERARVLRREGRQLVIVDEARLRHYSQE